MGSLNQGKDDAVHLSLVISGAVSLGTYEAGALVRLLRAVRLSQQPGYVGKRLVIDVIAGASAGAMTGAMVAYCLLTGVREDILYNAWVNDIDIAQLYNKYGQESALSSRKIRDMVENYLTDPAGLPAEYFDQRHIQLEPVRLVMSLTNLNGRSWDISLLKKTGAEPQKLHTFTYKDWIYYDFPVGQKWNEETWENVRKTAMASGAFPVAFEPVGIDDWAGCDEKPQRFSFTDGGVLNNQPLGLAIDAAYNPESLFPRPFNWSSPVELPDGSDRLFVLIQPTVGGKSPSAQQKYFSPGQVAFDTLFTIPRHQSLFEDLKRLQRTNQQLKWNDDFLSDLKDTFSKADPKAVALLTDLLKSKVQQILDVKRVRMPESKQHLYNLEEQREMLSAEPEVVKYFRLYTNLIGMMRGKRQINVGVIRPAEKDGEEKDILAGEFLAHFGGFLSAQLRAHDFLIGYQNAAAWLLDQDWNIAPESVRVVTVYDLDKKQSVELKKDARLGQIQFKDLPSESQVTALWTGIKVVEVLTHRFAEGHSQFRLLLNVVLEFLRFLAKAVFRFGGPVAIICLVVFVVGLVLTVSFILKVPQWGQGLLGFFGGAF